MRLKPSPQSGSQTNDGGAAGAAFEIKHTLATDVDYEFDFEDRKFAPKTDYAYRYDFETGQEVYRPVKDSSKASDRQVGGDHYKNLKPQPGEVIVNWKLNWHLGNALKYIARAELKGNKRQDLEKAIHYLQLELEQTSDNGSTG